MSDTQVQGYRNSVARAMEDWKKRVDDLDRQLAPVLDGLRNVAELTKKRDAIKGQMQKTIDDLTDTLMAIKLDQKTNAEEIKSLSEWMDKTIKQKGITRPVHIYTDVQFDLKAKELRAISMHKKWSF